MKRILSLVLALISVFSLVAAAAEETEMSIGYILNIDFDEMFAGESPGGIKVGDNLKKYLKVADVPTKDNKSFEIDAKEALSFDMGLEKLNEDLVFEFDIMFKNNASCSVVNAIKTNAGKEFNFFTFDSQHNLTLPSGEKVFQMANDKFYNVSLCFSTVTGLCDIYVNHKKVANKILCGGGVDLENLAIWRIYCRGVGGDIKPLFYMDNFKIYKSLLPVFKYEEMGISVSTGTDTSADYVAVDEAVYEYMGDAVALYVNQNKMFSHSEVTAVDLQNPDAAPYIKNGRTLVPIRAIADGFDAYTAWDAQSRKVLINYEDTDIEMTVGECEYKVNDEVKTLDCAPEISGDRVYVPIRAAVEAFGKKVTYDKSGLIVIADRENFWNYRDDLPVFRALAGKIVFSPPKGEEMVAMIEEKYPDNLHPRVMVTPEDKVRLREEVKTNEVKAKWYKDVINGGNALVRADIIEYVLTPSQGVYAIPSDEVANALYGLASAYLYSGDEIYAEKCLEQMLATCDWPDWNHRYTFLATATIMGAMATAYDWLYDYIPEEDRDIIREAIVEKGLNQIMEDYQNKPRQRTYSWAQSPVPDNWNIVCNSGALTAAIALCDEESEICTQIFDYGMRHIQQAVLMYGPDGAWYEGPNYWGYTTRFYVNLMAALDTAFGDTFGYMEVPGVAQTGYFITAVTGPEGTFNFHDAEVSQSLFSELFFFADMLGDENLTSLQYDKKVKAGHTGSYRDILWCNLDHKGSIDAFQKDEYYRDTEVATMRSGYNDQSAIYTALHAGKIAVYHGQMDMGQFIIDGFGTRFASDLGLENYNTPGENVTKYRYREEGHNTIVINPSMDGGQHRKGAAIVERFESGESSAFAITDMTSGYKDQVKSIKRGLKLTNNRSAIIVQDEIKSDTENDVWWFMHSRQPIEVSEDGKSALLYGEHRNMRVTLLQDTPGTFSVMDASPMPTSPKNAAQNKNLLFQKLAFHAEGVKDITIPIMFTFELPIEGIDVNTYKPSVVALDNWELEENGVKEAPTLSTLTINGEEIKGFTKDTLSYTHRLTANEPMPKVSGEGNGEVSVKYTDGIPGYAVVTVSAKEDKNVKTHYVIKMMREVLTTLPGGAAQLSIASVSESVENPAEKYKAENTIDGDEATIWSTQGKAHFTYDLGSVKKVGYVGLLVYQEGKSRQQYFSILVSEDGENFKEVYKGESTGTTNEEEIFAITPTDARYVRVYCTGTSVGEYNSIIEGKVYGVE